MNPSSAPTCPKCGTVLPSDAPAGLCPRCVMALNFTRDTATDGAPAQPPPAPEEIAPHFPQLEILECLGRGGMGVVYRARQKSLDRFVALKLLAPERVGDPAFAGRFAHEAKALAALNHPNIVTIHDFGQAGGFYYLLMEFVDGVNLRQAMQAGRFTPEQALAIVPPVCEALQYAHEHGIVHRDIKPENLLLDREGRVKIADFGVAKMLGGHADTPVRDGRDMRTGASALRSAPAGTPQYMAPEQKDHRATDHRADIYSLGVVLYEMLTGELPADKLQPPSKRVQVDVRIDEIVLRALEKTPELRFQSATEMRTQVETFSATRGVSARVTRRSWPNGLGVPALAVLLVSAVLCFATAFVVARKDVRPAIAAAEVRLRDAWKPFNAAAAGLREAANADARRAAQAKETELSRAFDERMKEIEAVRLGPSRWSMVWRILGWAFLAVAGGVLFLRARFSLGENRRGFVPAILMTLAMAGVAAVIGTNPGRVAFGSRGLFAVCFFAGWAACIWMWKRALPPRESPRGWLLVALLAGPVLLSTVQVTAPFFIGTAPGASLSVSNALLDATMFEFNYEVVATPGWHAVARCVIRERGGSPNEPGRVLSETTERLAGTGRGVFPIERANPGEDDLARARAEGVFIARNGTQRIGPGLPATLLNLTTRRHSVRIHAELQRGDDRAMPRVKLTNVQTTAAAFSFDYEITDPPPADRRLAANIVWRGERTDDSKPGEEKRVEFLATKGTFRCELRHPGFAVQPWNRMKPVESDAWVTLMDEEPARAFTALIAEGPRGQSCNVQIELKRDGE